MAWYETNAEFMEKINKKELKASDECYTPPAVYDCVLAYMKKKFNIADTTRIIRPFRPYGDYTAEDYTGDCIVIDNPPFSIFRDIVKWYIDHDIKFILYKDHNTLFNAQFAVNKNDMKLGYVVAGTAITYENGAKVSTDFVTNLTDKIILAGELQAELYKAMGKRKKRPIAQVTDKHYWNATRLPITYGEDYTIDYLTFWDCHSHHRLYGGCIEVDAETGDYINALRRKKGLPAFE